MAVELTEDDHKKMDALFQQILEWHASGEIGTSEAVGVLAHVFTAAAIDNAGEVWAWFRKPEVLRQWKSDN